MPIPPGDDRDYDRLIDELARRLVEQTRPGATTSPDVFGEAGRAGADPQHVLDRMDELVREQARLVRTQEADERRLQSLRERAAVAQTPEGRSRMAEEAGLRGQVAASRYAAAEPFGPPRSLFRQAEREDREAAAARRYGARIAEQEESRAARAAGPMGPPRELFRAQERKEAEQERARAEAERERQEAIYGRSRYGGIAAMAAVGRAMGPGAGSALVSGAAGIAGGAALGGVAGVALAAAAAGMAVRSVIETQAEYAGKANPVLGSTLEKSKELADVSYGANQQGWGKREAMNQQSYAAWQRGEISRWQALSDMVKYDVSGTVPSWYKEEVGLPVKGGIYTNSSDLWDRAQQAALQGGDVSAKILETQLKAMEDQNELLKEIRDSNDNLNNVVPNWRR